MCQAMKKIILSIAVLGFASVPILAKDPLKIKGTTKQCEVTRPALVSTKIDVASYAKFVSDGYESSIPFLPETYWDAYSDRDDNTTYTSQSGDVAVSSLEFGQMVRIAKIKKGYALVFLPDDSAVCPALPQNVVWKGWIPMSNLVVYPRSMSTSLGWDIKALFHDDMKERPGEALDIRVYSNPAADSNPQTVPESGQTFFYPVKEDGNRVLLSRTSVITGTGDLYGWVSRSDVSLWRSRIALEPTWNAVDAKYFHDSGIGSELTTSKSDPRPQGSIVFGENEDDPYDPEAYRTLAGEWRFPMLSFDTDGYLMSVPGTSKVLSEPSQTISVRSDDGLQYSQNAPVNLCVVIDGSRIYEPFFPILAETLSRIPDNYGVSADVRCCAIIYHDPRTGDKMIESSAMTAPEDPALFDFIDQGGEYGFKDNLSDSPLLSAIDLAADRMSAGTGNYIIVIGGRGDSSDATTPREIAEKLAMTGTHLYAIHVQNNTSISSYRLFSYLIEDILRSSVGQTVREIYGSDVMVRTSEDDFATVTGFSLGKKDLELFDGMCGVRSGQMTEDEFTRILEDLISVVMTGGSDQPSSTGPQFFRTVFTPAVQDDRQLYSRVAIYTEEELDNLISLYSIFNELRLHRPADRQSFVNHCTSILEGMGVGTANLKEAGYRDVFAIADGIELDPNVYSGAKLKSIESDKIVTPAEYLGILSEISENYARLLRVRSLPAAYSTIINDEVYYWVPLDDLL